MLERLVIVLAAAALSTEIVQAQPTDNPPAGATDRPAMTQHSITVYSKARPGAMDPAAFSDQGGYRAEVPGYAVVRTVRTMDLSEPSVAFTDVASAIDPTTVAFKSLSFPDGTRVIEQNYRYDLVSTARMLEQFLGQELTLKNVLGSEVETYSGTLMTSQGTSVVLQLADGRLVSLADVGNITFPDLPGGLITRPTLQWQVATDQPGDHEVEVSYETSGMTWWADYNLLLDERSGCQLDLQAWVSIVNQSGGSFDGARLKLIAGDVNRAPKATPVQPTAIRRNMAEMTQADAGFQEQAFFEYHLYTLGRPADLPDRSLKQLELFPTAVGVECQKQLLFTAGYRPYGVFSEPFTKAGHPLPLRGDVAVELHFVNAEDNKLGLPLPAGRVRVSQRNPDDGNLEFIGEDVIGHTPRNETLAIALGNAFDVKGERRQADFRWNAGERWMEETIEVELRNQKQEPATVVVKESMLRWSNWRVTSQSHEFSQPDAATIVYAVDVGAEQVETVRYTVRYEW
ncbi:MAG: DUF4139 domain-containing protein [Pseudomonadota bacterium]